jgi:hypothetical protein
MCQALEKGRYIASQIRSPCFPYECTSHVDPSDGVDVEDLGQRSMLMAAVA